MTRRWDRPHTARCYLRRLYLYPHLDLDLSDRAFDTIAD